MPAASRVSISGRRNKWFGTGRVMSQIRMQALCLPAASAARAGTPTGAASAARIAASGSGRSGIGGLRITVTARSSASSTGRPLLP